MPNSITRRIPADSIAWGQGPRHHPARHFTCAGTLQRCSQFIETGPRCHHVVNQGNVLAFNFPRTGERAAYIASPCIVLQTHLRRGVADALAAGRVERDAQLPAHFAGDFGSMVEATLANACCVQGHGNQPVGLGVGRDNLGQAAAQRRRDGEPAVVLQARDQAVERKRIGQRGNGAVKCRRVFEAGATHLAIWRRGGALRAVCLGMPGQVVQAARAQGVVHGRSPAEQAGVRG